ncbi:sigma-70 family RNA polymerase sigma factor [uncultured Duncaniella sp.]|uniref:RNA polymerase sigma factor n=2 Tax=uncultured Duncaniella sp. TaxID=2768039 RepID=UPI002610B228|nr:sigma-70 family RNA polymerase sigma factor [uncultured Duncaniella sp.]
MHTSDEIFRKFVAGKMAPFYERYFPGMVMYASRLLGNDLDWMADDCVQDAVLDAFQKRSTFTSAEQWRAHILACIRNKAVSALRKLSAMRNYADADSSAERHEADAARALIEHETLDSLHAAIRNLPDDYRQLLRMSFEEGMKNADIAAALGVAEITVKKRKVRLLEMLRRSMGDNCDILTIGFMLSAMLRPV